MFSNATSGTTERPFWFDYIFGGVVTYDSTIWRRLINDKEPVLFIGESQTRSLPIALGIMRGSFEGVYASTYDKPVDQHVPPREDVIGTQKERIKKNDSEIERRGMSRVITKTVVVASLASLERHLDQCCLDPLDQLFCLQADATKLEDFFLSNPSISTRNIVWQCPWVRPHRHPLISTVLLDFIKSASSCQQAGDALFIGVTTYEQYHVQYRLGDAFRQAAKYGYTRLTMDTKFIRAAIEHGYEHRTVFEAKGRQSHIQLMDKMEMYSFVKQS